MADEVRAREERLRAEVRGRRIEVGHARGTRKVMATTQTDYFRDLRSRAGDLRRIMDGGMRSRGTRWLGIDAPGRTRTCDLRIRSPLLYPAELQGPAGMSLVSCGARPDRLAVRSG